MVDQSERMEEQLGSTRWRYRMRFLVHLVVWWVIIATILSLVATFLGMGSNPGPADAAFRVIGVWTLSGLASWLHCRQRIRPTVSKSHPVDAAEESQP